ncbi:MAG: DUF3391 domain-containing protein, partial [Gammaproteobacteria bacterium]
ACMKTDDESIDIPSRNLVIGLYVDLELRWIDHPFASSRFVIRTAQELATIRKLKPDRVKVFPGRSAEDVRLTDLARERDAPAAPPEPADAELEARLEEKRAQQGRGEALRARRRMANQQYREKSEQIRRFTTELKTNPANAIQAFDELVDDLTAQVDRGDTLLAQLVDVSSGEYSDAHHVTNVTMLSLLLGAAAGLKGEDLKHLGTGAMLHDVGNINVPLALRGKPQPSLAEAKMIARHPAYGRILVQRVRQMDAEVLNIIEQHHEYLDGSGYPAGLHGAKLSPMVRIVSIVNHYDDLCNPPDVRQAMTPKSALARLYRDFAARLDIKLIAQLIEVLGIYPPGTVVELDNGGIALVIAARCGDKVRPDVLVYDAAVPKQDAVILRLAECEDLSI